jgi:hypothetical protein
MGVNDMSSAIQVALLLILFLSVVGFLEWDKRWGK